MHSHTIDFKELALGVAKLVKGSKVGRGGADGVVRRGAGHGWIWVHAACARQMEKLALMFELTDTNGDGTLDMSEVVAMIEQENADMAEASQFTEQVRSSSPPCLCAVPLPPL